MDQAFQGIVLFFRPHREEDALVKIFTDTYGTKMFFIRHFYRSSQTLRPHLLPLTMNNYLGRVNSEGLSFLKEAETVDTFRQVQTDPILNAHAVYLSQLIDASIEDNVADPTLYHYFKSAIEWLNQNKSEPRALKALVQVQMLDRFGLSLDWHHCQLCEIDKGPMDFSLQHQGLLCQRHWLEDPLRMQMNPKSLALLKLLHQTPIDRLGNIQVSEAVYRDIDRLMREIYHDWVGIKLKSESYLQSLYQFQADLMVRPSHKNS